jgi:hypothetical protein
MIVLAGPFGATIEDKTELVLDASLFCFFP